MVNIIENSNNLSADSLYNFVNAKFSAKITYVKDKKHLVLPSRWNEITINQCSGNEINIGIPTGKVNEITVIDFDSLDQWNKYKHLMKGCHIVKTKKGYHCYFKYFDIEDFLIEFGIPKIKCMPSIDFLNNHQFALYGKNYILQKFERELSNIPIEFLEEIKKFSRKVEKERIQRQPCFLEFESDNEIQRMLYGLDRSRLDNFISWRNIGFALKNSFGEKFKDLFLQWSKSASYEYPQKQNEKFWDSIIINENGFKVNSIWYWLKEDNLELFDSLRIKKKDDFVFGDYIYFINKECIPDDLLNFLKQTVRYVQKHEKFVVKNKKWDFKRANILPKGTCIFIDDKKVLWENFVISNLHLISVEDIIFYPLAPNEIYKGNCINLFQGWNLTYEKTFDSILIEPILNHIKTTFCKDKDDKYDYMIGWLASKIQKPREKIYTVLAVSSDDQGTGKGLFFDEFLGYIFGDYHKYRNGIDSLKEKFNPEWETCLFAMLDEIPCNSNAFNKNNELKGIFTQTTQTIEHKYGGKFETADYRSFVACSQHNDIFKHENSDRRYPVFDCDLTCVGNHEYFDKLRSSIKNQNVQKAFFNFLANYDLSDFNMTIFPKNELKEELKKLGAPNHINFIEHFGDIHNEIQSSYLYEHYTLYIKYNNNNHGCYSAIKFYKEMKNLYPNNRTKDYKYYQISPENTLKVLKKYYKNEDFEIEKVECNCYRN